jgi:hypothetical protein
MKGLFELVTLKAMSFYPLIHVNFSKISSKVGIRSRLLRSGDREVFYLVSKVRLYYDIW